MENSLLSIPKEKKLKPAFVLALLVHLALLIFLWIGVSWQSETGDTVEAEVWDIKVREAAPRAAGEQSELAAAEQAELQAQEESVTPPLCCKTGDARTESDSANRHRSGTGKEKSGKESGRRPEKSGSQTESG